jgi:membrane-bound lytic murein transglycosylase MltF
MQEEKGITPNTTICKVIKLSNGETIIGNITKETVSYIDVNMPLKILIMVRPDLSQMNMSVMKWDPTFDYALPIRVYKNSIVACAEPNEMMIKNYNEVLEQATKPEEEQGDEITEVNDMMQELLRRIKPNTMH